MLQIQNTYVVCTYNDWSCTNVKCISLTFGNYGFCGFKRNPPFPLFYLWAMVGSKAHDFIKQILPQWWARVLGSGLLCCLGGLGLGSPEIEKNQLIWFLIFTQPKTSTNLTQTNIQTNTSNACSLRYSNWLSALTATGALARTMGRAKAETTMPVVRNQASSRQGFDLRNTLSISFTGYFVTVLTLKNPLHVSWRWEWELEITGRRWLLWRGSCSQKWYIVNIFGHDDWKHRFYND